MITKDELSSYARFKKLNLGQAEKDYFQDIVLFCIYRTYATEMVFKGGTALSKCYGLDRFSEYLDFTATTPFEIYQIKENLNRFMEYDIEEKQVAGNNLKITMRITGPLYNGIKHSKCKLVLDVSYRENLIKTPKIKKITPHSNMPAFDVYVMDEEEIFAEKIRAICSREKARDIYDLWFLIRKGIIPRQEIINEKLKYYSASWDLETLIKRIKDRKLSWKKELSQLITNVPDFDEVYKEVVDVFEKNK